MPTELVFADNINLDKSFFFPKRKKYTFYYSISAFSVVHKNQMIFSAVLHKRSALAEFSFLFCR